MREYGSQAVVWQTAINPVVALELLADRSWQGAGVLGPEAFDAGAVPRSARARYGSPHGVLELRALASLELSIRGLLVRRQSDEISASRES